MHHWISRSLVEPCEPRRLLAAPTLGAGVLINAGSGPLTVSSYSTPDVADWNKDGRKDLVVGQFIEGNILTFLNQGTDAAPSFSSGSALRAAGVTISTSYG